MPTEFFDKPKPYQVLQHHIQHMSEIECCLAAESDDPYIGILIINGTHYGINRDSFTDVAEFFSKALIAMAENSDKQNKEAASAH